MPIDKAEIITAAIGAVVGWVISELTGIGKVKNRLAFVQGQLTQLLKIHGDLSQVKEDQAIMVRDQSKMRKDIDAAHAGLREVRGFIHTKG